MQDQARHMEARRAACSCGQLSIEVTGAPVLVGACSCIQCQRRTGSAFGISSYWNDDQVIAQQGTHSAYRRNSDANRPVEMFFCPTCGSTVFWKADCFPGRTGVAVGCFADPGFPEPALSVWNESRHPWVAFPAHWRHVETS